MTLSSISDGRIYELRWGDGDAGNVMVILKWMLELFGVDGDTRSIVTLGRYLSEQDATMSPQTRCLLLESPRTNFNASSNMTNKLRLTPLFSTYSKDYKDKDKDSPKDSSDYANMYKISSFDGPTEYPEFIVKMVDADDATSDTKSFAFVRMSMPSDGKNNYCNGDKTHSTYDMIKFNKCLRCDGNAPIKQWAFVEYDSIFSIRDITPLTTMEWIQENWSKILIYLIIAIVIVLWIRKMIF